MRKLDKNNPRFKYDDILIDSINKIKDNIEIILETGTFDGLGSTNMLSEIFLTSKSLEKFYTIEIDNRYFLQARRNLKKYNFVECLNGLSLNYNDCIEFMKNDDYVINHKEINDLCGDEFIENNAFNTYSLELIGGIFHGTPNIEFRDIEQNILINKLEENINKKLFLVLDSSGGIGLLEFKKVIDILKDRSYYLLLDDINHLKHYRSYKYIEENKDFKILYLNYENGNLLCEKL